MCPPLKLSVWLSQTDQFLASSRIFSQSLPSLQDTLYLSLQHRSSHQRTTAAILSQPCTSDLPLIAPARQTLRASAATYNSGFHGTSKSRRIQRQTALAMACRKTQQKRRRQQASSSFQVKAFILKLLHVRPPVSMLLQALRARSLWKPPEVTRCDRVAQEKAAFKKRQDEAIAASAHIREADNNKRAAAAKSRTDRASQCGAQLVAPAACRITVALPLPPAPDAPSTCDTPSSRSTDLNITPTESKLQLQASPSQSSTHGESSGPPKQQATEERTKAPLSLHHTHPQNCRANQAEQTSVDNMQTLQEESPEPLPAPLHPGEVCHWLPVLGSTSICLHASRSKRRISAPSL